MRSEGAGDAETRTRRNEKETRNNFRVSFCLLTPHSKLPTPHSPLETPHRLFLSGGNTEVLSFISSGGGFFFRPRLAVESKKSPTT